MINESDTRNEDVESHIQLLDRRLQENQILLGRAGWALSSFFEPEHKAFLRDSQSPGDQVDPIGATSTCRSVIAQCELLRVMLEEGVTQGRDQLNQALQDDLTSQVRSCAEDVLAWWLVDEDARKKKSTNGFNSFTDAQLVAAVIASEEILPDCLGRDDWQATAAGIARARAVELTANNWRGFANPGESWGHDFITLYVARAASMTGNWEAEWSPALKRRVARDVARQLGWFSAGVSTRFDPGELAMSLALLAWLDPGETDVLLPRCLEVLASAQSTDGAWPTSRVIAQAGGQLLHIASYDIGLALGLMLQTRLSQGRHAHADTVVTLLDNVVALIESTYAPKEGLNEEQYGWSNDRTKYADHVESWATAAVVGLLARRRDCLLIMRDAAVLGRLGSHREPSGGPGIWPDAFAAPVATIEAPTLERVSDPSPAGLLRSALRDTFIQPILSDPARRPSRGAASFVMPGPPGTRKTSLCSELARALGWPLVVLTPPSFLQEGLDGLERNADRIFGDLLRLRRAVVLFDEFEELVKRRAGTAEPSTMRTGGAFITQGMLPRLQSLRDRHWVIFTIAFNGSIEDLDEAVLRPGRFDYRLDRGHPTQSAQTRYINEQLEADHAAFAAEVLEIWHTGHEGKDPKDSLLTWADLDRMIEQVRGLAVTETDSELKAKMAKGLRQQTDPGPPKLC